MSTRWSRPSSATGATSSARGARRAVLFDQSHHMAELTDQGAGCAQAVLAHRPSTASRISSRTRPSRWCRAATTAIVIGDGILFYLDEDELLFVGRAPTVNWLQFQAETGGFECRVIRDDRSPSQPDGNAVTRRHYRYQIQGPQRDAGPREAERRADAGRQVLQYGRDQHQGTQGPRACAMAWRASRASSSGARTKSATRSATAILEAGKDFGIVAVGARAYASNTLESGWIPSPLPAVYTGEKMQRVSRVAAGERLRRHRLDRRQLRLRRTSRTTT